MAYTVNPYCHRTPLVTFPVHGYVYELRSEGLAPNRIANAIIIITITDTLRRQNRKKLLPLTHTLEIPYDKNININEVLGISKGGH